MPRFRKNEKLRGRKNIESLLKDGKSFNSQGFKVIYRPAPLSAPPIQLAISVPKRIFPRAVDRNRIRRLIRESFRRYKETFCESLLKNNIHCILLLVVVSKEIPGQQETHGKIELTLRELGSRLLKLPPAKDEPSA